MKKLVLIVLTICIVLSSAFGCGASENPSATVDPLSLDKSEITLTVGEETMLTANYDDVLWDSENNAVAVVVNGTVTAISAGSTKIVAKKGEETVKCDVTVTTEQTADLIPYPVLVFSMKARNVLKGYSFNTEAFVLDNGERISDLPIVYSSDNDSVVSVTDSGKVTAVGEGNATIIASVVYNGRELTADYEMAVVNGIVSVSYENVLSGRIELYEDAEFTVEANLFTVSLGEDGELKDTEMDASLIEWVSDDENVATVADGVINTKNSGKCVINSVYEGETLNSIVVNVLRDKFTFEKAGDMNFITSSGVFSVIDIDDVIVGNTSCGMNDGGTGKVLQINGSDSSITLDFGHNIKAGTKVSFDFALVVPSKKDLCHGSNFVALTVNGQETYYWHFDGKWKYMEITIPSTTDKVTFMFGLDNLAFSIGTLTSDIRAETLIYLDNIILG